MTSEHDRRPSAAGGTDWEGAEHSPEFQELVRRRRAFVIPCTIFFLSWYLGFILLAGYAPDFMGESVYQGLTVGYLWALSQFLMVFVLGLLYLRQSERVYDPLARKAAERARTGVSAPAADGDRPAAASTQAPATREVTP